MKCESNSGHPTSRHEHNTAPIAPLPDNLEYALLPGRGPSRLTTNLLVFSVFKISEYSIFSESKM
jgi:hypothetical protein